MSTINSKKKKIHTFSAMIISQVRVLVEYEARIEVSIFY